MSRTARSPALFAILVGGFALLPLSTDLYLASLPGLARDLGVEAGGAQATLSAFILGFAFAQLVYGPLSDRWGRRPTLIAGVATYLAATLLCVGSPSIGVLVAGRFLQGVGACCGTVVARAAVRDAYGAEGAARMMGYIASVVGTFPLVGPIVGGFVESALGWRWNLGLLASFGALLLLVTALWFPETSAHRSAAATQLRPMLANYRRLAGDRRYAGYVGCLAATYSGLFAFISGSSFVLIGVLGVPPSEFGFWFGGAVLGYLGGSYFTGHAAHRLGPVRMMRLGTVLIAVAGSAMLALALDGAWTPIAVVLPMTLYLFAGGITMPNSMAGALSSYPRIAGSASSLMGLVQMAAAAAVGAVVGRAFDGTPVPMAAAVAAMSWTVVLLYYAVVRPAEHRAASNAATGVATDAASVTATGATTGASTGGPDRCRAHPDTLAR